MLVCLRDKIYSKSGGIRLSVDRLFSRIELEAYAIEVEIHYMYVFVLVEQNDVTKINRSKNNKTHPVPQLCHLEARVHVLRVTNSCHTTEGLQSCSAVNAARAHAHGRMESVLIYLSNHTSSTYLKIQYIISTLQA